MVRGSLSKHCQTYNNVAKGGLGKEGYGEGRGDDTRMYRMTLPAKTGPRPCPVEGCSGRSATQTAMRVHFWHWHVQYTVVILEEGNLTHPQCPLYNILVMWQSLNGSHKCTAQYKKGAYRKGQILAM